MCTHGKYPVLLPDSMKPLHSTASKILKLLTIALAVGLAFPVAAPLYAGSEPCTKDGNVIPQTVCDMDSFRGSPPRRLPNGWTEFILSGNPSFEDHPDTFWGPPSLMIRTIGEPFKVGIYTQVDVTPSAGYRASIAWGAPNRPYTTGRQLGIDPYGGTDPNSSNVIWGPMHRAPGRILNYPPPDVNIDVRARAVGNRMTVFFLVDHPESQGDDVIFIDAIALYPDESAPAPAPTPTPIPPTPLPPPTVAPVIVAAAVVPTDPPTFTPTPTNTPTPTATPTNTATPSPTPTFTPTATPSWTPLPTVTPDTRAFRLEQTQMQLTNMATGSNPRGLLLLGLLSFGGAGVFGGSLWWLRRQ